MYSTCGFCNKFHTILKTNSNKLQNISKENYWARRFSYHGETWIRHFVVSTFMDPQHRHWPLAFYILEVHMGWSMHGYDDVYFNTQEPRVTPAAPLRFRESCSPLSRCHARSNVDDLITPCAKFVRAYTPSRIFIAPWPTTRMFTMLAT